MATRRAAMTRDVLAQLDDVRPRELRPAAVEPFAAEGWLFERRLQVRQITAQVAGRALPAVAMGIATPETHQRYRSTPHRSAHAAHCGFIVAGLVPTEDSGASALAIMAELADGVRVAVAQAPIPVRPLETQRIDLDPAVQVAIVMATFEPPDELFASQIDSLRRQTHDSWACIISDDGSDGATLAKMRQAIGADRRFHLVEHSARVGFYLNFERALAAVPPSVRYIALADQDDVWRPHKLARLVEELDARPGATLCASDVRLVARDGAVLSDTFYIDRAPTHDDPYSLFLVNSLVGAAMLFRRSLLDVVLPFPRAIEGTFHDHWLARAALMTGSIAFVAEPLHDYVQHAENVLGASRSPSGHMRHLVTSSLRLRVTGAPFPQEWRRCFVLNVVEPWLAAHLLAERLSVGTPDWLARIASLDEGQLGELKQLMLDHHQENRRPRRHREWVELSLVAGRAWAMSHRPSVSAL